MMKEVKPGTSTSEPVHPIDRQFTALGLQSMVPISKKDAEFTTLQDYLLSSKGQTHDLDFKV